MTLISQDEEDTTIVFRCSIKRENGIEVHQILNLVRWIAVRMRTELKEVREALREAAMEDEINEAIPASVLTIHRLPRAEELVTTVKAAAAMFISKALRESMYCYRHPAIYRLMTSYTATARMSDAISAE